MLSLEADARIHTYLFSYCFCWMLTKMQIYHFLYRFYHFVSVFTAQQVFFFLIIKLSDPLIIVLPLIFLLTKNNHFLHFF